MSTIDTMHPDAEVRRANEDVGPTSTLPSAVPHPGSVLAAFRNGRSEVERTADLLAFAIATERGLAPTPDAIERARREAESALGDYSIRHLHNTVEQIRQEAVAAHLGRLRSPPGFPQLVAANLVALAAAGALCAWLWTLPDVRAAFAGLMGG
jgi:hypothetical protein